jgi:hypothetical protein
VIEFHGVILIKEFQFLLVVAGRLFFALHFLSSYQRPHQPEIVGVFACSRYVVSAKNCAGLLRQAVP